MGDVVASHESGDYQGRPRSYLDRILDAEESMEEMYFERV